MDSSLSTERLRSTAEETAQAMIAAAAAMRPRMVKAVFEINTAFARAFTKDEPMVYEVCIVRVDEDDNAVEILLAPTAVVARDENAAIVAATGKLREGTDTSKIKVLVRPFR